MALKTVSVKITEWEAVALLYGANAHLGHIVANTVERDSLKFLIDKAKADVAKWQAVLDTF